MIKIKQIVFLLLAVFLFGCDVFTSPEEMNGPSNISLTVYDWNSILLTWQDNTSNETKYRIDRKVGDEDWEKKYKLLSKNSESFIDADLAAMGNYSYRVYARNSGGSSDFVEATYHLVYDEVTSIVQGDQADNYIIVEEEASSLVNLLGSQGSLLQHDCLVWIKIISAPEGTSVNNITNPADSVSVMSYNGVATLTIGTGEIGGELIIETYAYNPGGEKISAQLSTFVENKVGWIDFLWNDDYCVETMHSAYIPARIRDIYGTNIMGEHEIFCKLLERPEGTNIDDRLFEVGETISLYSSEGTVAVPLNCGTLIGDLGIKLFSCTPNGNERSNVLNITIIASEPAYGELYYGGDNEGHDLGNGYWKINLDAFIGDVYQNPEPAGYCVEFTLIENNDDISLESEYAITGDSNSDNAGIARNFMTYNESYINDTVIVRIQCGNYVEEFEVILPVQDQAL